MKTSSEEPPPDRAARSKAWTFLVTNLLVLPGLGSVMAGCKSGYAQILLALGGFGATLAALVKIALDWARDFILPDDQRLYATAIAGLAVFLLSWCWSLLTSLALFRKEK